MSFLSDYWHKFVFLFFFSTPLPPPPPPHTHTLPPLLLFFYFFFSFLFLSFFFLSFLFRSFFLGFGGGFLLFFCFVFFLFCSFFPFLSFSFSPLLLLLLLLDCIQTDSIQFLNINWVLVSIFRSRWHQRARKSPYTLRLSLRENVSRKVPMLIWLKKVVPDLGGWHVGRVLLSPFLQAISVVLCSSFPTVQRVRQAFWHFWSAKL